MHLTLEQQRVDGAAEIVDHRIAFNGNCPGIRIDLDLDDVAAVRESLCRRRARMCCVKTGCHARRQFGGISRRLRRLENVQMKTGARHAEHPVVKADVLRRYFENMRGELPALLDDRESGFVEGAAGDSEGARASCQSTWRTIGVAHDDIYPVGIDAELLRYELVIRGEKTSAVFLVAHYQLDPIVLELDRGGLRKSAATALSICRHADAAQFAVTLALRAPPREGRPFRRGHAAVHHLFKLTRIEKKFCRRSVRHCR